MADPKKKTDDETEIAPDRRNRFEWDDEGADALEIIPAKPADKPAKK